MKILIKDGNYIRRHSFDIPNATEKGIVFLTHEYTWVTRDWRTNDENKAAVRLARYDKSDRSGELVAVDRKGLPVQWIEWRPGDVIDSFISAVIRIEKMLDRGSLH